MKVSETDIINYIAIINLNFDSPYANISEENMDLLINTWYDCLKDYPKELCDRAMKELITSYKYKSPKLPDLIAVINEYIEAESKTANELFEELRKVLPKIQRCVDKFMLNTAVYDEFGNPYEYEIEGKKRVYTVGQANREWAQNLYDGLSPELKERYPSIISLLELYRLNDEQFNFEKNRFEKELPVLRKKIKLKNEINSELKALLEGNNVRRSV